MREYTTLGEGKATKVLAVATHHPARTVTTADADTAKAVAFALSSTDRVMAAALHPIAIEAAGNPVEARRRLLNHFDTVVDGNPQPAGGSWHDAEELVSALADAVAGRPAAVVTAVRNELAEHLYGFDGILVPATISTPGRKRMHLDLVVSPNLDALDWDYICGPHGDVFTVDDDDVFPVGGPVVAGTDIHPIVYDCYSCEPVRRNWFEQDSVEVMERSLDDNDALVLTMRADLFEAWVAHHRPDAIDRIRELLAARY